MIVNNNVNAVEFGNVEHGGEFKIRNSAKAFSILSSGLYANKIRAIVRELSCNAVDSHTAAKNVGAPFEVHLPNRMEPFFSVRDFGTGLAHDDVMSIYTTYFESTKTGSNDFIGALGLGSKSPFSYTDNFTVTAIKNGEKNIYTAYINEMGLPSITRMSSSQSDEPAGVLVSFAVKEADFSKFQQEAQSVYSYFKLQPKVSGVSYTPTEFKVNVADIIDGVSLMESTWSTRGAMAIMGNVAYPIEVPNADMVLGKLATFLRHPFHIEFNIGELDVQASREGLSYIPATIASIKDKLEKINKGLARHVKAKFDTETNAWNRLDILAEYQGDAIMSNPLQEYLKNNKVEFVKQHSNGVYVVEQRKVLNTKEIADTYNIELHGWSRRYNRKISRDGFYGESDGKQIFGFRLNSSTNFVEYDLTKAGIINRMSNHLRNNGNTYDEMILMQAADETKPADFKGFLASLHQPKHMLASALDVIVRAPVTRSATSQVYVSHKANSWSDYEWHPLTMEEVTEDEDDSTVYYYVNLEGKRVQSAIFGSISLHEYIISLSRTGMTELKNIELYGIRAKTQKVIADNVKWVNVEDYIKTIVSKYDNEKHPMIDAMVCNTVAPRHLRNSRYIKFVNQNSPLVALHAKLAKGNNYADVYFHIFERVMAHYISGFTTKKFVDKLGKEWHNIESRYPLLEMVAHAYEESTQKAVAEYINLIDNQKGV